jgi:anaerobic magnesium-protoporphyrin IX monomethyl ester cyclase
MRFIFINCIDENSFTCTMPLAACYLTSYLKGKLNEKLEVKSVSVMSRDKVMDLLKEFKPDLVGLSMTTQGSDFAKAISKQIKDYDPKLPIIAGGPHFSLFKDIDSNIDYAVYGEGEITFAELINYLFPGLVKLNKVELPDIKGLIYKVKREGSFEVKINEPRPFIKDLDSIGHPNRDLLNPTNNTIFTSRGCPYNCVYCSSPIIWKRTFRKNSAQYIFEDIKDLYTRKHSFQWISDDLFAVDKDRIKELIRLLREAKLLGKISFCVLGRTNLIDTEMARLLRELNVVEIQLGFETGDDDILKYAKNDQSLSVERNRVAYILCKREGILTSGGIMIGFPTETHESIGRTFDFFTHYSDRLGAPNIVMVFPQTQLSKQLLEETGKDYAKIHETETKLKFGDMPVNDKTNICKNLTPQELVDYRNKFAEAGKHTSLKFNLALIKKLIFSKGFFLNMYYFYRVAKTQITNPHREYVSPTVEVF